MWAQRSLPDPAVLPYLGAAHHGTHVGLSPKTLCGTLTGTSAQGCWTRDIGVISHWIQRCFCVKRC
jgi:hypothetical protein